MIKFILHGGSTKEDDSDNDAFFRETTSDASSRALILLNYFAREEEEVGKLAERDKKKFLKESADKELIFEVAKADTFGEQMQRADVLYISGGDTKKLVDKMSLTPGLETLFRDKIIAGSSAGVYVLSKYYWSNDKKELGEGLGILNFKALCHYKPEDTDSVNELLAYKEDLPLLTIPDHKWVVIYQ